MPTCGPVTPRFSAPHLAPRAACASRAPRDRAPARAQGAAAVRSQGITVTGSRTRTSRPSRIHRPLGSEVDAAEGKVDGLSLRPASRGSRLESGLAPGPWPRPGPGWVPPGAPKAARGSNLQRTERGRPPCPCPGPPAGRTRAWRTCRPRGWLSASLQRSGWPFLSRSGPGRKARVGSPHARRAPRPSLHLRSRPFRPRAVLPLCLADRTPGRAQCRVETGDPCRSGVWILG